MTNETEQLALKALGWSKEQLEKAIVEKQREYGGLANEERILKMLVEDKRSGASNSEDEAFATAQNELDCFSEAKAGQLASFFARVAKVFPPREFDKNGRHGRVANVLLADSKNAYATLILWNDLTSLVEEGTLQRNTFVRVENAFVKSNTPLEFHARSATRISRADEVAEKFASSSATTPLTTINEILTLSEGSEVDVVARVFDAREPKEFVTRDGRPGLRQWLLLVGDDAARIPLIVWNNAVSLSRKLARGDEVRLESVFVKKNASGAVELHANNSSMIFLLKKGGDENVPVTAVGEVQKIAFIEPGVQALVSARITRIFDARVARKCIKCGQREGFCNCVEKSWRETLFVSVVVEDDSGEKRAVFFSEDARKLLGAVGIVGDFDVGSAKALEGKSFSAFVLPRINAFSGELELVVKKIVSIS